MKTTETALLMPMIIFTILMSVYLTAHVHNRALLGCSAAEQAISGHEQEDPLLFAAGELSASRKDTKQQRSVKYTAGTFHFSGEKLWGIEEERVYKKYRPVELIRKRRAVERLKGG